MTHLTICTHFINVVNCENNNYQKYLFIIQFNWSLTYLHSVKRLWSFLNFYAVAGLLKFYASSIKFNFKSILKWRYLFDL